MDSTEKNVLLIGGLGLAAVLFFSWAKQQQLNAIAAANQPGLNYQPSMPYPDETGTLGSILSGVSIGTTALGNLFAGFGSGGTANDPGLDSGENDIAYPGNDYTNANSNPYSPGVTQLGIAQASDAGFVGSLDTSYDSGGSLVDYSGGDGSYYA